MSKRRSRMFVASGVFAVALVGAIAAHGATLSGQEEFSSANRQVGKAAVEFTDPDIHIVAAYYYSQRNHDSRWLMIETAVSAKQPSTIHRKAMTLRTPEGREIPLATQQRVGEDVNRIQQLLQNAKAVSHNVASYFNQRDRAEPMNLFRLPFGNVVSDDIAVNRDRVSVGPLFFESPTGAWAKGTYALIIRHSKGVAQLPIILE